MAAVTAVRRAEEAAAREAADEEARVEFERTGGFKFEAFLRGVPTAAEGERLVLPPSVLEVLEAQGALDPTRPLAFEVAAVDPASGVAVETTHCGVLEFTAAEGTVGVPPQAALSLTKARGVAALAELSLRVKFVRLPAPAKSSVRLQPRGAGFHDQGQDVVSLDLKATLTRLLSRHTCLTQGDWLALRHDKRTYALRVVALAPAPALALVHTDLEVRGGERGRKSGRGWPVAGQARELGARGGHAIKRRAAKSHPRAGRPPAAAAPVRWT